MVLNSSQTTSQSVEELPERRRGFRIRQQRPVKVFEPTLSRYFAGQTHDLSPSGLRLDLPASTPIEPGRSIQVHVGSSESAGSLVRNREMIPARIVWIDRNEMIRGRLVVGVEFLKQAAMAMDAA